MVICNVRCDIKGDAEIASLCESFNRLAERLKTEDELRRHLTYQLTHELRTSLTILRVNVEAMRDGIIEPFQNKFKEKGLYLKIEGPKISVNTDPEKLTIIIRNLLQNSLRYTNSGGITIRLTGYKKKFMIEVSDTGRGIEPSKIPYIFKRFYKDEDSRGLGIGLSIVDGLVSLLNGTIDVKSEISKRTVFTVYLREME